MDKETYIAEGMRQLGCQTFYRPLENDPTNDISTKITKTLKRLKFPSENLQNFRELPQVFSPLSSRSTECPATRVCEGQVLSVPSGVPVVRPERTSLHKTALDCSDNTWNAVPEPSISKEDVPVVGKCDHLKFKLPTFGPWEAVLNRKAPIGGDVRRAIVDILFQECMKLALYPSHRLYRRSAELLVFKFPHMRDNFSVNGKMGGHCSWVEALKCKFKTMRKKLDDNPAVLAMRDKHGKKRVKPPEEACPNATKRVSRLHGHEHLIVLGETEQSL
ncbi:uncharacterized protein LOC135379678 [Ornithodoros turicata]|uniref:uncharacterized protein LOC135379678 n=1 Tax=Ornithodoros turicata TaxID=34597 RepID=UPI003139EF68